MRRRILIIGLALLVVIGGGTGGALIFLLKWEPLDWNKPPHFVRSIGGLTEPASIALGSKLVYVAETGGERLVHIYDAKGKEISSFAPPGSTSSSRLPVCVAVGPGPSGEVYVVDAFRHDVSVYSPDGIFLRSWVPGNDPNFAWAPVALAFDQEGNLYFADQMQPRQQVLVFDSLGNLKLKFGYFGIGTGMFNFPSDIAVDDLGNIYVSDSQNFRVQVFDAQGNFLRVVATSFGLPTGVGIDRPGRLHVVDSLANEVLVIDVSDAPGVVFKYGSLGLEGEQFFYPRGIALDLSGKIYVADYSGNRVQIWSF